ncbi:MAG TPA: SH3 domain-containing protein [Vicinamibacterales bacterium]
MSVQAWRSVALAFVIVGVVAARGVAQVPAPPAAQGPSPEHGTVRVTVARANVRAEASETSKVLAQVTQGMELELLSVEGDWFYVRVPVSGLRLDAYISKKVAKLAAPSPPPAPGPGRRGSPPAQPRPSPPPAPVDRDGMSVVMTVGDVSTPLERRRLRVIQISDKAESLAKIAPVVRATGDGVARAGDASAVTFVWVADEAAATRVITERRPSFLAVFKDVPGLNPEDLAPVLVRLTPAASGVRLIAALRGRADQASRTDPDWDVVRDLKQDIVRTDVQKVDRGSVRITPAADLPPGEYAIVLRLASKRKVAGSALLGSEGEGRVFSVAWDFAVKGTGVLFTASARPGP